MKISIVTLTYNQLEKATKPYIESLYRYTNQEDFELIIIDNASSDGTREYLENIAKTKPNVKVIFNSENKGYSKGNNQGLNILDAKSQYIGLFNNDILFTENWLENTIVEFEKDASIGLASPRINKNMKVMNASNYLDRYKAYLSKFKSTFDYSLTPYFCCVVFTKELFNKVGFLDENFTPAFYEDDDYSFRALYAGYRNGYVNTAFILHNHCTTSGSIKGRNELLERNRAYFYSKHYLGEYIYEKAGHGKSWLSRIFKRS